MTMVPTRALRNLSKSHTASSALARDIEYLGNFGSEFSNLHFLARQLEAKLEQASRFGYASTFYLVGTLDEEDVRDAGRLQECLDGARTIAEKIVHQINCRSGSIPHAAADLVLAADTARSLANDIGLFWDIASEHSRQLQRSLLRTATSQGQMTRTSYRLMQFAVRILPIEYQADYSELFQSELLDMADCGKRWRHQVQHALRILVRAPQLRLALRWSPPATRERAR